ncbi:helix-turn-helix domain-containing protein [Aquamicrobium soli]|uniref:Helix-turn-helix domain-containing protein n=1 Tax=Aquamicrobium soli TaxID=1811518 RepID=A0ABV7K610_9HYPH
MLSETLTAGLKAYGIGAKIRELRQKKDLSLVQLGEHTGLSPGMLSKIERGQLFPTLPTLLRVAMVFGVGLEHFFIASADRPALAIVRKKDRVRLPDRPGDDAPSYFFESLDFPVSDRRMEAFYAEFEPRSEPPVPHSHAGAEVIFVMSGQLVLNIGDEDALLGDGDSIYFNSGFSHSYRRQGHARCSAIVVVSPDKR